MAWGWGVGAASATASATSEPCHFASLATVTASFVVTASRAEAARAPMPDSREPADSPTSVAVEAATAAPEPTIAIASPEVAATARPRRAEGATSDRGVKALVALRWRAFVVAVISHLLADSADSRSDNE